MKKKNSDNLRRRSPRNGYNEANPVQPHGSFAPAASHEPVDHEKIRSTTSDKKKKEDQN